MSKSPWNHDGHGNIVALHDGVWAEIQPDKSGGYSYRIKITSRNGRKIKEPIHVCVSEACIGLRRAKREALDIITFLASFQPDSYARGGVELTNTKYGTVLLEMLEYKAVVRNGVDAWWFSVSRFYGNTIRDPRLICRNDHHLSKQKAVRYARQILFALGRL